MLVAQVDPPHVELSGDWFYRNYSPGRALAEEEGISVISMTNANRHRGAVLHDADVVVLNVVVDPDLLPVLEARRAGGKVTIYEINDDVSSLQPWNPTATFFSNPDSQRLFRRLASSCDGIQFCTAELERIYGPLHQTRALFPNQLSRSPGEKSLSRTGPLVVGWGGSQGHLEDMARIAEPLIAWFQSRDDVVLHIMGSNRIASLFARLLPNQLRVTEPGNIDAYYQFLATLDIGIAPLANTGFNRSRSDVKFLEYAIHGAVPVVQKLAPYLDSVRDGETGLFFQTADELVACLRRIVDEPDLRLRISIAARQYAETERSERKNASRRAQFYHSLLRNRAPSDDGLRAFDALSKVEGASQEGRYLALHATRFERSMHDALVVGLADRRSRDALTLVEEAVRLEPSSYQAWLTGAAFSPEPVSWLRNALRLNPQSIKTRVDLGVALGRVGVNDEALEMLRSAVALYPNWEVPYRLLAQFFSNAGNAALAERFHSLAQKVERQVPSQHGVAKTNESHNA